LREFLAVEFGSLYSLMMNRQQGTRRCLFLSQLLGREVAVRVRLPSLQGKLYNGEFDPGSERTLAAWIRHASRTRTHPSGC
jgi:hypothetical protein